MIFKKNVLHPISGLKKTACCTQKIAEKRLRFSGHRPTSSIHISYINNVDKKRRSESVRASSQENHENHIKSFTKIQPREFWQENHARKFHHVGLPPSRENQEDLITGTLASSRCLSSSPTLLKIWSRFPDPEELMDAIIAIPVYHASGGVTSTVTPPVMSQKKMYNYCMSSRLRKRPVMEFSATATCSGVPLATTSPPPRPPSGPMSMI